MRMVSWIVVVGALAWLIYAQLRVHFPEETDRITDASVIGTLERPETTPDRPEGDKTIDTTEETSAVAEFSYAELFPVIDAVEQLADLDRLDASITVSSHLGIPSSEIQLILKDGEDVQMLTVHDDGTVLLPRRVEWRAGDQRIVSNQPRGSLALGATVDMRVPSESRVEYAWLWESVAQVEEALRTLAAVQDTEQDEVVGVIFYFGPEAPGMVRKGTGTDRKQLSADERGVLALEMNAETLAKNPMLEFSALPQRMLPLLAQPSSPSYFAAALPE